jgi:hypothetical protein
VRQVGRKVTGGDRTYKQRHLCGGAFPSELSDLMRYFENAIPLNRELPQAWFEDTGIASIVLG